MRMSTMGGGEKVGEMEMKIEEQKAFHKLHNILQFIFELLFRSFILSPCARFFTTFLSQLVVCATTSALLQLKLARVCRDIKKEASMLVNNSSMK